MVVGGLVGRHGRGGVSYVNTLDSYIKQSKNHSTSAFHLPLDDNTNPIRRFASALQKSLLTGGFLLMEIPSQVILLCKDHLTLFLMFMENNSFAHVCHGL